MDVDRKKKQEERNKEKQYKQHLGLNPLGTCDRNQDLKTPVKDESISKVELEKKLINLCMELQQNEKKVQEFKEKYDGLRKQVENVGYKNNYSSTHIQDTFEKLQKQQCLKALLIHTDIAREEGKLMHLAELCGREDIVEDAKKRYLEEKEPQRYNDMVASSISNAIRSIYAMYDLALSIIEEKILEDKEIKRNIDFD